MDEDVTESVENKKAGERSTAIGNKQQRGLRLQIVSIVLHTATFHTILIYSQLLIPSSVSLASTDTHRA